MPSYVGTYFGNKLSSGCILVEKFLISNCVHFSMESNSYKWKFWLMVNGQSGFGSSAIWLMTSIAYLWISFPGMVMSLPSRLCSCRDRHSPIRRRGKSQRWHSLPFISDLGNKVMLSIHIWWNYQTTLCATSSSTWQMMTVASAKGVR